MEPQNTYEYDAFISYRRSDGTRAAQRLRKLLKSYRLPKSLREGRTRRLAIFLDTVYERGASDFYEKTIRPALMASRHLVVIATPDAIQRPAGEDWIAREVADFSNGPRAGNVIVVRAIGDFADVMPADIGVRYPHVQIVDMRDDGWIARLLPQRASRIADERLKIVAPLFDIPLELMPALRREEERQQMGRLGTLAGITASVILFTVALSIFALNSQWQGQKALQQNLQVSEDAIFGITEQYAEEEALDSISRDLVISNCDLARQLALRLGETPTQQVKAACAIEEGVASGIVPAEAPASVPVEAALKVAEALYFQEPEMNERLASNIRAGYRAWAMLEAARNDVSVEKANGGLASFERAFAAERMSRPGYAQDVVGREEVLAAFSAARGAAFAQAERLERVSQRPAAREMYRLAAADARAALDAVDIKTVEADRWNELSWDHYAASYGYALLAPDGEIGSAIDTLNSSVAVYESAPSFDDQERKSLAARADIAMEMSRLRGRQQAFADQEAALWNCLDLATRSLELTKALAQATPDDYAQRAESALLSCREDVGNRIDARRAEVNRLVSATDDAAAAPLLREVVDLSKRINIYRPGDAWGEIYIGIALSDLAAMRVRLGDDDGAERVRLEAADIYRPHIENIDGLNLSAGQASEARRTWDDMWRAHYEGYSDVLERKAAAQTGPAAIELWAKVIEVDDRWDDKMPRRREWDVVYQCKLRLALAWELRSVGDYDRSWKTFEECYLRIEPYQGKFQLPAQDIEHAKVIWSEVLKWRRENAPIEIGSATTPATRVP